MRQQSHRLSGMRRTCRYGGALLVLLLSTEVRNTHCKTSGRENGRESGGSRKRPLPAEGMPVSPPRQDGGERRPSRAAPAGRHLAVPHTTEPYAYVTLLHDDRAVGVRTLGASIRATQSAKDVVVMVTEGVGKETRRLLEEEGLKVEAVDAIQVPPLVQRSSSSSGPHHRTDAQRLSYSKLQAWGLTQYEKLIVLDSDMLVLDNIDELFACGGRVCASMHQSELMKTSLLVVQPNQALLEEMISALQKQEQEQQQERGQGQEQKQEHSSSYSFDGGVGGFLSNFFLDFASCALFDPLKPHLALSHQNKREAGGGGITTRIGTSNAAVDHSCHRLPSRYVGDLLLIILNGGLGMVRSQNTMVAEWWKAREAVVVSFNLAGLQPWQWYAAPFLPYVDMWEAVSHDVCGRERRWEVAAYALRWMLPWILSTALVYLLLRTREGLRLSRHFYFWCAMLVGKVASLRLLRSGQDSQRRRQKRDAHYHRSPTSSPEPRGSFSSPGGGGFPSGGGHPSRGRGSLSSPGGGAFGSRGGGGGGGGAAGGVAGEGGGYGGGEDDGIVAKLMLGHDVSMGTSSPTRRHFWPASPNGGGVGLDGAADAAGGAGGGGGGGEGRSVGDLEGRLDGGGSGGGGSEAIGGHHFHVRGGVFSFVHSQVALWSFYAGWSLGLRFIPLQATPRLAWLVVISWTCSTVLLLWTLYLRSLYLYGADYGHPIHHQQQRQQQQQKLSHAAAPSSFFGRRRSSSQEETMLMRRRSASQEEALLVGGGAEEGGSEGAGGGGPEARAVLRESVGQFTLLLLLLSAIPAWKGSSGAKALVSVVVPVVLLLAGTVLTFSFAVLRQPALWFELGARRLKLHQSSD